MRMILSSRLATVTQDHAASNRLFVSEDMPLLRKCPCPVLLLKPSQTGSFKQVLAAIDFDRAATDGSETGRPG